MDLTTYKIIHLIGLMLLFFGLGGLSIGALTASAKKFVHKPLYMALHGTGLVFILVSGFGMMARLNIHGNWPTWLVAKLLIWLALGAIVSLVLRWHAMNRILWVAIIALGATSAYMALFKPF